MNNGKEQPLSVVTGDRFSFLFAKTLKYIISLMSEGLQKRFRQEISIGVICTAYSNGAFMNSVIHDLGFMLVLAKTGVKHLEQKTKLFDISLYFESNGHGTLAYAGDMRKKIEKLYCFCESSKDTRALEFLSCYVSLFNQTVGDSVGIMLAVEASLHLMGLHRYNLLDDYSEYESINTKVVVKNKNVFRNNEDETRLTEPIEIQHAIDATLNNYKNARCFIRPSGTEDILRVYTEAESYEEAKIITEEVLGVVMKFNESL